MPGSHVSMRTPQIMIDRALGNRTYEAYRVRVVCLSIPNALKSLTESTLVTLLAELLRDGNLCSTAGGSFRRVEDSNAPTVPPSTDIVPTLQDVLPDPQQKSPAEAELLQILDGAVARQPGTGGADRCHSPILIASTPAPT